MKYLSCGIPSYHPSIFCSKVCWLDPRKIRMPVDSHWSPLKQIQAGRPYDPLKRSDWPWQISVVGLKNSGRPKFHGLTGLIIKFPQKKMAIPRCSMYGIFTYIWVIFGVNVGKYSIHGASGIYLWLCQPQQLRLWFWQRFRLGSFGVSRQSLRRCNKRANWLVSKCYILFACLIYIYICLICDWYMFDICGTTIYIYIYIWSWLMFEPYVVRHFLFDSVP